MHKYWLFLAESTLLGLALLHFMQLSFCWSLPAAQDSADHGHQRDGRSPQKRLHGPQNALARGARRLQEPRGYGQHTQRNYSSLRMRVRQQAKRKTPVSDEDLRKRLRRNRKTKDAVYYQNRNFILGSGFHYTLKIAHAPFPTRGQPWPLPQEYIPYTTVLLVRIEALEFRFRGARGSCEILDAAMRRYRRLMETKCSGDKDAVADGNIDETFDSEERDEKWADAEEGRDFAGPRRQFGGLSREVRGVLRRFWISMDHPDCTKETYPSVEMNEYYTVAVNSTGIFLHAVEVWGILRGLETVSQLFYCEGSSMYINQTFITDFPRFIHRGLLIDTARHYLSKEVIFKTLDAMSYNKMNVLHWHITDDQSFPLVIESLPRLHRKGSYNEQSIYTHKDVAEIVEYARLRGVRVIPEIDSPGHVFSWGRGYPHLLTECYFRDDVSMNDVGPLNPARDETYKLVRKLLAEVRTLFKDEYIHIGGDEVPKECWISNAEVREFYRWLLNTTDFGEYTLHRTVWNYYVQRLHGILRRLSWDTASNVASKSIVWQEVFDHALQIPRSTIIQVWKGNTEDVRWIAKQRRPVVYSTCWYLNYVKYGADWKEFYECDPLNIERQRMPDAVEQPPPQNTREYEDYVLGGEACVWGEYINENNLIPTTWPRASAVAERLWSRDSVRNITAAASRLEEQNCRMLCRGLEVGVASGPGSCRCKVRRWTLHQSSHQQPPPPHHHQRYASSFHHGTSSSQHKARSEEQGKNLEVQSLSEYLADCKKALASKDKKTLGNSVLILALFCALCLLVCTHLNSATAHSVKSIFGWRALRNTSILNVFFGVGFLGAMLFLLYPTNMQS